MNILFTGHKGFLGREMIPYLSQNHNVLCPNIRYTNSVDVDEFIKNNPIDVILHAAIKGGRIVVVDEPEDCYDNILMFENLAKHGIKMINFDSGASYDRRRSIYGVYEEEIGDHIPVDYYGLSKFVTGWKCGDFEHTYNLRFFNVWGPQETDDRFTKVNVDNYINGQEIVIFRNKYMDFFYIEDTKKVVDLYLSSDDLPKNINLVYPENVMLTDVANIINNLSKHNVPVKILKEGLDNSYCGNGSLLRALCPGLLGLEKSFKHYYESCIC